MAVSLDESFQGHLLNIEQKVACKSALVKVQLNEDLPAISFWGQIQGVEKDYLIAQALVTGSKDFQKKFYFSNDEGVTFSRLPPFDDWASKASNELSGPLTGQPSHKYPRPLPAGAEPSEEEAEPEPEDEDEDAKRQREAAEQADPTKRKLTELERLSWLVAEIDRDTSIVPVGAYCLTATQEIVRNPYFNGLSINDAKSLSSFLLTRPPKNPQTLVRLHQAGIANVTQFLDNVAEEQPKGSWTLHIDDSGLNATVRSLVWPGYEFKAAVGSPFAYGGAYFGTGERNSDLVFML